VLLGYLGLVVVRFDRLRGLDSNVDPLSISVEPLVPASAARRH